MTIRKFFRSVPRIFYGRYYQSYKQMFTNIADNQDLNFHHSTLLKASGMLTLLSTPLAFLFNLDKF